MARGLGLATVGDGLARAGVGEGLARGGVGLARAGVGLGDIAQVNAGPLVAELIVSPGEVAAGSDWTLQVYELPGTACVQMKALGST